MEVEVEKIVQNYGAKKGALISILQDIQAKYNWLPPEALEVVAEKLSMSTSEVFGVATFYNAFSLRPRGKHLVTICMGTACHVRGAPRILEETEKRLKIRAGETSRDMKYTLETVYCLGCCAIGPVFVYDGEYFGQMSATKVESILKKKEE
jgi:NADH-quinone oxidoreductase subunit E